MSSLTISNGYQSPMDYLGSLLGSSINKLLTRKLKEVTVELEKIKEIEFQHLEKLNQYKSFNVEDLTDFEKEMESYGFITDVFETLFNFIDESKSKTSDDDKFLNDLILLKNQIFDVCEVIEKVNSKLHFIHNKILIKTNEQLSSDVLKDIWKDEEEIWDNFYLESHSA